jgi:O-antigen ligase
MSPRLRFALVISFVLNGTLILAGSYRRSYDAYIHMFFADHYRLGWWELWEPRWYGGFDMQSYPPLVHQLIALPSLLVGIEPAFVLIFLALLTVFPLGVYAFACIFSGQTAAEYAALCGAVLPAVYYSAHTFGQLPTLFSLFFGLLSLAALAAFLRSGHLLDWLLAVSLAGTVSASHHATLLFLPPAMIAVALHLWLNHKVRLRLVVVRSLTFALPAALVMILVVWPFWQWSAGQSLQTPIDHPTRHSILHDPLAFAGFFLTMYGPLVLIIPWIIWRAAGRRMLAPGVLFALLFVLGLGGTTALPKLLFGPAWAWLTYDRFSLWACVVLLVFLGQLLLLLERRVRRWRHPGRVVRRSLAVGAAVLILGSVAVIDGLIPLLAPVEPPSLNMAPIQRFLAANNGDDGYYYLTFGFGDQLALLSRLTGSRSLDGSYHTARPIPELRGSGLAQMDTAFWFAGGMPALDRILDSISARGVRWAFVNRVGRTPVQRQDYVQLLRAHGWRYLTKLPDGVQVWDNPSSPQPARVAAAADPPLAAFSWGSLPLLAFSISGAFALARWRPITARLVFRGAYLGGLALLPMALTLWYFRPLAHGTDPRVYLIYGDVLFFVSDGLVLMCVIAWGLEHLLPPTGIARQNAPSPAARWLTWSLLGLASWTSLSVLWSIQPALSLAFAVQAWLLFAFYCSVRDHPEAWRAVASGCAAALTLQVFIGLKEWFGQATAFLSVLGTRWPGDLTAATQGASVVQLEDGTRWLRLYGSLPHPNVMAGLLLLLLSGAAYLASPNSWRRWPAVALFGLGIVLLVVTFSRAAWLGLIAAGAFVLVRRRSFDRHWLVALGAAGLLGALVAAVPLFAVVRTRLIGVASPDMFDPEVASVETRYYLMVEAGRLIQTYPLLGSGAGTFVPALSRLLPPYFAVEPVHNMFLLAVEEIGPVGGLLALAVSMSALAVAWSARTPGGILSGALVLSLLVVGLFDHYLWTLPPMRTALWLALALLSVEDYHA